MSQETFDRRMLWMDFMGIKWGPGTRNSRYDVPRFGGGWQNSHRGID
ncbi:MAG: hypothetical protein SV375_14215 [Thermodesulfobacteriota bacterium]|nr:hypothetical protein [Thermodesulfobacteriota bacterium]